jgi:hypothetical protein
MATTEYNRALLQMQKKKKVALYSPLFHSPKAEYNRALLHMATTASLSTLHHQIEMHMYLCYG